MSDWEAELDCLDIYELKDRLTKELDGDSCGVDPKYELEFSTLKQQFNTLGETNYALVIQSAVGLLENKTKDLRVAAYLMFGLTHIKGLNGFIVGLDICCTLLDKFGDNCHPVKLKLRKNLLNWFSGQQKKLIKFIEDDLPNASDEKLLELNALLLVYNNDFRAKIDSSLGSLQKLAVFLEPLVKKAEDRVKAKKLEKLKQEKLQKEQLAHKIESKKSDKEEGNSLSSANTTRQKEPSEGFSPEDSGRAREKNNVLEPNDNESLKGSFPPLVNEKAAGLPSSNGTAQNNNMEVGISTNKEISSDSDMMASVRQLLHYFKEKKDYNRMVSLSRSIRWSSQPLPISVENQTKIPAVRESAIKEVSTLLDKEEYEVAFLKSESIFMEGSAHLNFELQQMSALAAKKMGKSSVAKQIEKQVQLLFSRLPEIKQLKFSNGEAFMPAHCTSWIDAITAPKENNVPANYRLEKITKKAKSLSEDKGLLESLQYVANQGAVNSGEYYELKLLQASLALDKQRVDISLPILKQLEKKIGQHKLDQWCESFAMNVWRLLERAISLSNVEGNEDKIKELRSLMFLTNPAQAAAWFS